MNVSGMNGIITFLYILASMGMFRLLAMKYDNHPAAQGFLMLVG